MLNLRFKTYETDENNNSIAEYTWDDNGQPLTITKNGVTYHYNVNGHGDVTALTDANGNIVAEYEYDAWGNVLSQTGSMASQNPLRYAGYYYDDETKLYYLTSRYYDPSIGRFLTRDTFHGFEDDAIGLNQYVYTKNNPVIFIDPDGHWIWIVVQAGLAVLRFATPLLTRAGPWMARTKIVKYAEQVLKPFKSDYWKKNGIDIDISMSKNHVVKIIKKGYGRIFSLDYHRLPEIKNKKGKSLQSKVWHYHIYPKPDIHHVFRLSVPQGYNIPNSWKYRWAPF